VLLDAIHMDDDDTLAAIPQRTWRFKVGRTGAGTEIITGVTCGTSLDWLARSGTAMLSSKGLAMGGGKDFHPAGSAWRAGDVVEVAANENGNLVFSMNAVVVKALVVPGAHTHALQLVRDRRRFG
jgi:hypothetical protein